MNQREQTPHMQSGSTSQIMKFGGVRQHLYPLSHCAAHIRLVFSLNRLRVIIILSVFLLLLFKLYIPAVAIEFALEVGNMEVCGSKNLQARCALFTAARKDMDL